MIVNLKRVYGVLNVIKKMPLSKMGNPKYRVEINGDIFETVNNAMLGYAITNYDNKEVIAQVRFLKTKNVIDNVIFRRTLDNDFKSKNTFKDNLNTILKGTNIEVK